MKRTLVIADETHELEIRRGGGKTVMIWDGEEYPFDILRVEPTSYSVIMDGHSVGVNIDRHPQRRPGPARLPGQPVRRRLRLHPPGSPQGPAGRGHGPGQEGRPAAWSPR